MSIQSVIIVPVTLSLLLVGVHFVQLAHGGQVAAAAANRGAQVASAGRGDAPTVGSTIEAVRSVVDDLGSTIGAQPVVVVDSRAVTVSVEVVFDGAVPFLPDHVRRSVTVPREQFLREDER